MYLALLEQPTKNPIVGSSGIKIGKDLSNGDG